MELNSTLLYSILSLFVIVLAGLLYNRWNNSKTIANETTTKNKKVDTFATLKQDLPTKCFSCERETGKHFTSYPSKCFDCEKDLVSRNLDPMSGQPRKCFDCYS